MYVYIYIYIYIYIYGERYTCIYIYIYIHTCIYKCIYTHMFGLLAFALLPEPLGLPHGLLAQLLPLGELLLLFVS